VRPGNTAGSFDGGCDMQQEFVNTVSGGCSAVSIATRSRSETGAVTVPGPTRTAVNCRRRTRHVQGILYFRRSADCVDNPGVVCPVWRGSLCIGGITGVADEAVNCADLGSSEKVRFRSTCRRWRSPMVGPARRSYGALALPSGACRRCLVDVKARRGRPPPVWGVPRAVAPMAYRQLTSDRWGGCGRCCWVHRSGQRGSIPQLRLSLIGLVS
jgi:hypothetical protein